MITATLFLAIPEASAATPDPGAVSAAYDSMMARPSDADLAVQYARVAAANGRTRAAIAALERVLRIDPGLDNVRLMLASLYLSENNPALASLYGRQAMTSPAMPSSVAGEAKDLVAAADQAKARSKLNFSLTAGVRYDSDANQATSLATIGLYSPLFGAVVLPAQVRAMSDWSSTVNLQASHSYDLGLQREAAWETNFSGYDQRFFHINNKYDLDVATVDTGPRVALGQLGPAALSIRPLATVTWLGYGNETFAWLYGGGASLQARFGPRWLVDLTGLARFGSYQNSTFRPTAELYTGTETSVTGTVNYLLTARTKVGVALSYYNANAHADYYARSGPSAALTLATEQEVFGRAFGIGLHAGVQPLNYRAPDTFISLSRRRDPIVEAGFSVVTPITAHLKAVVEYNYSRNNSNYQVYHFDNHAVNLGLRFNL